VTHLTSLRLAGWRSIRDAEIQFRPLNVLIGANGAGKSNLVSFFKAITEMTAGRLQEYIGRNDGAESLLHYGSKRTQAIEARFCFTADMGEDSYYFHWGLTAGNSLVFIEESFSPKGEEIAGSFPPKPEKEQAQWYCVSPPAESLPPKLGQGHRESLLERLSIVHSPLRRSCAIS
jgi:predicted ATPase